MLKQHLLFPIRVVAPLHIMPRRTSVQVFNDTGDGGGNDAGDGGGGKRPNKYNCWCATLHSPTNEELNDLWKFNKAEGGPVPDQFELGYLIIASDFSCTFDSKKRSKFPSARMYIEFLGRNQDTIRGRVRITQLMKWFPRTEFEPLCGVLREEARDQCKMAGKWLERGVISTARQALNKKEAEKRYWLELIAKIQSFGQWADLLNDSELAPTMNRRSNWAKAIWDVRPTIIPFLNLRATGFRWQCRFQYFLCNVEPDDRNITHVVNPDGGAGKSHFAKYMFAHHNVMLAASAPPDGHEEAAKANYYLFNGQTVIIFDVSRKSGEPDYNCAEVLKNGCVISTKFEPKVKVHSPPHLLIFCNVPPTYGDLSADRWNVISDLSDKKSIYDFFPPDKFPAVLNLEDPFGTPAPISGGDFRDDPAQTQCNDFGNNENCIRDLYWETDELWGQEIDDDNPFGAPAHVNAPATPVSCSDFRDDLAYQEQCNDFSDHENSMPDLCWEMDDVWGQDIDEPNT